MESSGMCCVCVDISSLLLGFISFDSLPTVAINPIAHGHFNIDISDNIFQLSCFFIVGPISLASSSFSPLCYNFSRCSSSSSSRWYTISICWFSRPTTILPIPHTSSTRKKEMGGQNKYRLFQCHFLYRRSTWHGKYIPYTVYTVCGWMCGCKPIVSVLTCIESWQATRAGWRRIRGKSFSLSPTTTTTETRRGTFRGINWIVDDKSFGGYIFIYLKSGLANNKRGEKEFTNEKKRTEPTVWRPFGTTLYRYTHGRCINPERGSRPSSPISIDLYGWVLYIFDTTIRGYYLLYSSSSSLL
jgi:hypothetical protein